MSAEQYWAKAHFIRGLELLPHLPESPERDRQEIRLRTGLGPVLMTANGYSSPEVVDNYTRAHELCQEGEPTADVFPVLWGLWQVSNARDQPTVALELAKQVHLVAQAGQDPIQQTQGHHAMWTTLMHCGHYEEVLQHVEQGAQLYQPRHHHLHAARYGVDDPGVCCRATGAEALWYLGYFDQALEWAKEAVALAKTLEHPFSLSHALSSLIDRYRDWHNFEKVFECHEALIAVCTEHGFQSSLAVGEMEWGLTLILQQQAEAGIERIHNGLEMFKSMGILFQRPWVRRYLAVAYGSLGRIDEAMAEIQHGFQYIGDSIHKAAPELHRIKGTLHLLEAAPNEGEAETCFQRALDLARHLKALPLELRAAVELAQLWAQQGKRIEALALLEPIYDRFTEGYGVSDLQKAKQVLQEWGRVKP